MRKWSGTDGASWDWPLHWRHKWHVWVTMQLYSYIRELYRKKTKFLQIYLDLSRALSKKNLIVDSKCIRFLTCFRGGSCTIPKFFPRLLTNAKNNETCHLRSTIPISNTLDIQKKFDPPPWSSIWFSNSITFHNWLLFESCLNEF